MMVIVTSTPESLKLGEQIHAEFGSWKKVREAATLVNGVYVLPPRAAPAPSSGEPTDDR
jgi:hypothetical protein